MSLTDYAKSRNQFQVAKAVEGASHRMTQEQMADMLCMSIGTFKSALRLIRERQAATEYPEEVEEPVDPEVIEEPRAPSLIGTFGTGNVGIIGDTHIPYEHPDYLQFCKETFVEHKVDTVIHIGDLIDNHALSFHTSEPGLRGSRGEYENARVRLRPWYTAFPDLKLVYGNHDAIPARQLKNIGMDPDLYLRPLEQVYGMPEGWSIHEEVEIDGVLYHHGHTSVGVNGFRNDSKARFQSTVSGHAHGNSGVSYTATDRDLVYGCATGCGIDVRSMAFAYGKHFKQKPIISCAVVKDRGRFPLVIPMPK